MSLLVASAVVGLVLGQDTGGPYTGLSGSCIDNKGQMIEEGRLFEPGPDECQVRYFKHQDHKEAPQLQTARIEFPFSEEDIIDNWEEKCGSLCLQSLVVRCARV